MTSKVFQYFLFWKRSSFSVYCFVMLFFTLSCASCLWYEYSTLFLWIRNTCPSILLSVFRVSSSVWLEVLERQDRSWSMKSEGETWSNFRIFIPLFLSLSLSLFFFRSNRQEDISEQFSIISKSSKSSFFSVIDSHSLPSVWTQRGTRMKEPPSISLHFLVMDVEIMSWVFLCNSCSFCCFFKKAVIFYVFFQNTLFLFWHRQVFSISQTTRDERWRMTVVFVSVVTSTDLPVEHEVYSSRIKCEALFKATSLHHFIAWVTLVASVSISFPVKWLLCSFVCFSLFSKSSICSLGWTNKWLVSVSVKVLWLFAQTFIL